MKRIVDLIGAVLGLLLIFPLFLVLSILIRIKLGPSIIFRQPRAGLHGKEFTIFKFRTLLDLRDPAGNLKPDCDRLTPLGRFLRSTSLDELPELLNVLKGEMSLVGPRPLLLEYLDLYTPEQARRHRVRPGITGWAQVNGRNDLTWEERFQLDNWYIDHYTPWLDLKIALLTVSRIVSRRGISAAGHATMPKFTGRPDSSRKSSDLS